MNRRRFIKSIAGTTTLAIAAPTVVAEVFSEPAIIAGVDPIIGSNMGIYKHFEGGGAPREYILYMTKKGMIAFDQAMKEYYTKYYINGETR